jgi:general transcription factor 3C polypeptide 1
VLSQQFLTSVSKSPFPSNAGKRAAKLSSWLHEREKDLVEGGVDLTADLQCGDIFQLFAQVSSGELSISPCMPVEGVGEAEDLRSLKHKNKEDEFCDCDRGKKLKSLADSELFSRREKGFPGIVVSLHRAAMQTINSLDLLKDGETCSGELRWNDMLNSGLGQEISWSTSCHNNGQEILNFGSTIPTAAWPSMAPWEAMTCYLEYLVPKPYDRNQMNPDVFRTIYAAIQKAGDQGLSMEEISQVTGMPAASGLFFSRYLVAFYFNSETQHFSISSAEYFKSFRRKYAYTDN